MNRTLSVAARLRLMAAGVTLLLLLLAAWTGRAFYDATINQRLAKVPDDAVLFPGHLYAPDPHAPMGEVRATNYVYRFKTPEQWRVFMGG